MHKNPDFFFSFFTSYGKIFYFLLTSSTGKVILCKTISQSCFGPIRGRDNGRGAVYISTLPLTEQALRERKGSAAEVGHAA